MPCQLANRFVPLLLIIGAVVLGFSLLSIRNQHTHKFYADTNKRLTNFAEQNESVQQVVTDLATLSSLLDRFIINKQQNQQQPLLDSIRSVMTDLYASLDSLASSGLFAKAAKLNLHEQQQPDSRNQSSSTVEELRNQLAALEELTQQIATTTKKRSRLLRLPQTDGLVEEARITSQFARILDRHLVSMTAEAKQLSADVTQQRHLLEQ